VGSTELADRAGSTLANLSILETGKARAIRFSTWEAICRALGCQAGDLLGYEEEEWFSHAKARRRRAGGEAALQLRVRS
jgi:putative transcriptional regulator